MKHFTNLINFEVQRVRKWIEHGSRMSRLDSVSSPSRCRVLGNMGGISVGLSARVWKHVAMIFAVLVMSIGQAWGADINDYATGFETTTGSWSKDGGTAGVLTRFARTGTGGAWHASNTTSAGEKRVKLAIGTTSGAKNTTYQHVIGYVRKGVGTSNTLTTKVEVYIGSSLGMSDALTLSTSWQRISYSKNKSSAWSSSTTQIRFTTNFSTSKADTVYFDDLIWYSNTSATIDLTRPSPATSASATTSSISWTNGSDTGEGATGIQTTLIFHRTGGSVGGNDLTLNDQGIYSLTATEGPKVVGNWTLLSASVGAAATSYSGIFVAGHEYAIVHRDLAYNYSTPTYVTVAAAPSCGETAQAALTLSSNSGTICGTGTTTFTVSGGSGEGTLSVSSSDDTKATATIDGTTVTVTGVATGSATIAVTKACDATYAEKTATYEVTVAAVPSANAGEDKTTEPGEGVALAATAAADGCTGAWTIQSGPNTSTAQLSSTSSATATFTPTVAGTYTLRWTVTNTSSSCSAYDEMTVSAAVCSISSCGNATLTYAINGGSSGDHSEGGADLISSATASNTTALGVSTTVGYTGISMSSLAKKAAAAISACYPTKPNMSGKIGVYNGAAYNSSNYLQFAFTVKTGYTFTPCDIEFTVQPVDVATNFRWEVTDGTNVYGYGTATDVPTGSDGGASVLTGLTSTAEMEAGTYYIRLYPFCSAESKTFRISNNVILKGTTEEVVASKTVYLKNTMGWANAYLNFYRASYWDESNGAGNSTASASYISGPIAMSYDSETGMFYYETDDDDELAATIVSFTKDNQSNYGNFNGTEAIYSFSAFAFNKAFVPVTLSNTYTKNNGNTKYYTYTVENVDDDWTGYYLWASGQSWEPKDHEFTDNGDGTLTFTKSLSESTKYQFKINEHNNAWGSETFVIQPISDRTFASDAAACALYTGPAGEYTFTINTTTKAVSVSYPSVTHPVAGYAYFKKWNDWAGYYVHWWNGSTVLTTWGSDPQITTDAVTICSTDYVYFPILSDFPSLKVKDNAGDASHYTGDLSSTGSSGKYFDFTNNNAWNTFGHKVSYDANKGSGTMDDSQAPCNSVTLSKCTFTRTGWTFIGWNTNKYGGGTSYEDEETIADLSSDLTLYAQWERTIYLRTENSEWWGANAKLTIHYWDGSATSNSDDVELTRADNCSDPRVYKATISGGGYNKLLFYRLNPANDAVWTQTVDLDFNDTYDMYNLTNMSGGTDNKAYGTFSSSYSAPTYTISFNAGGGSSSMSDIENIACEGNQTIPANGFTRTGYSFTGWTADVDVTVGESTITAGGDIADQATLKNITSDITLTAQWTANTYTVTLNENGGTINAGDVDEYTYGVGATLPTNVTKTGYTFGGWYDNSGLTGDAVTEIADDATGDKEFWAKWTAKTTTITINANTANHGSTSPGTVTATWGSALPSFTAASGVSGYDLAGYYTDATSGTKIINDDGTLVRNTDYATDESTPVWKYETGTLTLYAQYEKTPCPTSGSVYTLTFVNSSKVTMSDGDNLELTSTYATITGGAASIKYFKSGNKDKEVLTTGNLISYGTNDMYLKLELDCPLLVDDTIRFADGSGVELAIATDDGQPMGATHKETTSSYSYVVTSTDNLVGESVLYIGRSSATTTKHGAITIKRRTQVAPTFTSPAADQAQVEYTVGDAITALSVTVATSTFPAAEYQWYRNATKSTEGASSISGATEASYTPSNEETSDYYYYCVASNSKGSATSHYFRVTVNPAPTYDATYDKNGHGTAPDNETEVTDVTLPQMDAVSGWKHTGWTADKAVKISGESVTAGTELEIGAKAYLTANTTFTAVWTETYAVEKGTYTNGSITISPSEDIEGGTISLTATPNDDYLFTAWTIKKKSDGTDVTSSVSLSGQTASATFTMPAYAVTVDATFAAAISPVLTYDNTTLYTEGTPSSASATLTGNTGGGDVIYSVSPTGVVSIDAGTGAIEVVATGSATVTASVAAANGYAAATATCDITVKGCDYQVIAGVTLTGKDAGTPQGSLIASSSGYGVNTQKWESPSEGCGTGGKIGGAGNYVYLTLKADNYFASGDSVIVDLAKVPDIGDSKLRVYTGTTSAGTEIGTVETPICGKNRLVLSNVPASTSSITIERNDEDATRKQNPYIISLIVKRASCSSGVIKSLPGVNESNWGNSSSWLGGVVPTISDHVVITNHMTVNTTTAQAKEIELADGATLTISAGNALVVANSITKNGSHTEVADLHIGSSSAGNGSLVMGSHDGTNQAQVDFYTKAYKKAEDNWVNQYIGTPFNVADGRGVKEDYYGSYLYSFDFGTQSWVNIQDEDYHFTPFLGYNIIRKDAAPATLEMQGKLVATTNQSLTLSYDKDNAYNENVLANSWTAPIKIKAFSTYEAFSNVEASIYIFNAGGAADAESGGTAGNYTTYSVGSAGSAVIPSMQSFSVYATGSSPTLTLNYSKLVYDSAMANVTVQPNYAPRRMKAAAVSEEMQPIRLRVSGESGYADELKIYLHEDFSDAFENGWDAHKMYGYPETPQLYAVTDDGELAILCAPDAEATLLGFKAGEADTEYTFTFRYDSDEPLFLLDMQNNTYTEVQTGNAYTFQTSDVGAHNRFVLTRFAPQTPTDVENSAVSGQQSAVKLMIDQKIYILLRGVLYDATGKRVNELTNERVNE